MSFSGARSGEVINVLVKHYNPNTARVLIADTKNGDPREVLLPPFVNDAMRLLPMGNPEARLFGYASRFSLVKIIKRGCNRAKIQYFSPHKVGRHTFASRFLADGHSLKALQEAGGWRTIGSRSQNLCPPREVAGPERSGVGDNATEHTFDTAR